VAAVVALVGLLQRRPWAPGVALAAAIATVVGFALFHALPVDTAVTEPYWGDGTTNVPQVLSLVAIGAAAAWVVVEASAALRLRRDGTPVT
jgi:hypothetical protein